MIEITPFKAEDMLEALEMGIKEVGVSVLPTEQLISLAQDREDDGHNITGRVNGHLIGVGGVDILWPGVANMWMMVTPVIDKYVLSSYKAICQGVDKLFTDNHLWRAETYGRVDFPECHVLLSHIGFKPEGLTRQRMPDKTDAILYARLI